MGNETSARGFNRGDIIHLIEVIAVIGGLFAGWQFLKDQNADTARRIVLVEANKADKESILLMIGEQSRQIGDLAKTVKEDHDIVMRNKTMLDQYVGGSRRPGFD